MTPNETHDNAANTISADPPLPGETSAQANAGDSDSGSGVSYSPWTDRSGSKWTMRRDIREIDPVRDADGWRNVSDLDGTYYCAFEPYGTAGPWILDAPAPDGSWSSFFAMLMKDFEADAAARSESEKLQRVGIYTVSQMEKIASNTKNMSYLVQDYIPARSIVVMVGDSGVGKSPLAYQLGLCIAAGVPFLGMPTTRGRVLYLDFEDSIEQATNMARVIAQHLGLDEVPDHTFRLWSQHTAVEGANGKNLTPFDLIREYRPDFTIIDTLSAAFPIVEAKNQDAATLVNMCRKTGSAVMLNHHERKESDDKKFDHDFEFDLARQTTSHEFGSTRGAGAIINNVDVRLKAVQPRKEMGELEFIVRGYRRVVGSLPSLAIKRDRDENGEPIGHVRIGGRAKLNPQHRAVFDALPDEFRYKVLNGHFTTSDRAKTLFINACVGAGVLVKPARKGDPYRKVVGGG
jgi:hypothetical protein